MWRLAANYWSRKTAVSVGNTKNLLRCVQQRTIKSSQLDSSTQDIFWSTPVKKVLENHPNSQYTYSESCTVIDCVRDMTKFDLSSVLVFEPLEEKLRWLGIFSERDVIRKVAAQGRSVERTQLKTVHTSRDRVETITIDKTVQDVVDILVSKDVQNIAVLYQKKHGDCFQEDCYGVLTSRDLATFFLAIPDTSRSFFNQQTVKDVLETKGLDHSGDNPIYQINQSVTVDEAIQKMDDHKVGTLLVTASGDNNTHRVVGLLTERNYLRKCLLSGKDGRQALVKDIMTTQLPSICLNTTVSELLENFGKYGERSLPIIAQNEPTEGVSKMHPEQMVFVSVKEVLSHCLMIRSSTEKK
eukprot:jgi/Galph1/3356/GphlegSOOS_G2037.1